ncbi:alpha-2,8-sialyltransferase 8B-like [Diadema setosum]|uniref:alpha-2,8-sialyltransferase 8B-like n=1 Tax=Diadema setosum TaxID=31175 RepID=UPI003B3AB524
MPSHCPKIDTRRPYEVGAELGQQPGNSRSNYDAYKCPHDVIRTTQMGRVSSLASAKREGLIQVFQPDTPPRKMKTSEKMSVIVENNQTWPVPKVRTCSIVGNAGILDDSVCGDVIDEADMVIRLNLAYFGGKYGRDVGSKVNIMTLNLSLYKAVTRCFRKHPVHLTYEKYTEKCRDLFDRLQAVNGSILWHFKPLGHFKEFQKALTSLHKIGIHVSFAYSPKRPVSVARRVFKLPSPSTGIAIFTAATQFCSEIRLFGFYPFYQDPTNRTLRYHYYDEMQLNYTKNKHKMPHEFELLMNMEKRGVLRVINDCAGKWDNRILRCKQQNS